MKRFFTLAAGILLTSATGVFAQLPSYQPNFGTTVAKPAVSLEQLKAQFLAKSEVQKGFRRLGTTISVIAPASDKYNAYSYVMGITDRWLAPKDGTAESQLLEMDQLLAPAGYRRLSTFDTSVQPGKQKAVVFGTMTPDGDLAVIKSAALQHADGSWSCKIGGMEVIQFPQLGCLRGEVYGAPLIVYERVLPGPTLPVAFGR